MANPIHLSPAQAEQLMQILGRRLNADPQVLKQQIQSGNFSSVSKSMGNGAAEQLQQILRDPKQIQQMMNSQQMQQLLRSLSGQK